MTSATHAEVLKPVSLNPMLSGLAEPSLPNPISWLPNAPGWYLLVALLICFAVYRGYRLIRQYQVNAYRRLALAELERLKSQPDGFRHLPQLLRKTALCAYPRCDVAPLLGSQWEAWLDLQCKNSHFANEFKGVLASIAYSPNSMIDEHQTIQLIELSAHWIKHHEVAHDRV
ncbi:hypothetical protein A9264_05635 [Vibrio sp. UCD-FRSSP16_10]|uniref:DUF4381 domain-containing protein n=1 Tax=unclassified Vibrio TaxID=2614977 RepID=UPI0007FEB5BF|nr:MULTISPECIES: DUF4381 domain-containing protein [unclassified Vibrio]OBT07949.1 hypothetical protein A9260_07875 [Vibrio sp. UCD-FRSSP16_30]OBT17124.1 hypothetical protein A9264_05635 [Vibrio sp. UCD-FRSSP16_10]